MELSGMYSPEKPRLTKITSPPRLCDEREERAPPPGGAGGGGAIYILRLRCAGRVASAQMGRTVWTT